MSAERVVRDLCVYKAVRFAVGRCACELNSPIPEQKLSGSYGIPYEIPLPDDGGYIILFGCLFVLAVWALCTWYCFSKKWKNKRVTRIVQIEMAPPVIAFQKLENETAVWLCIPSGRGTPSGVQQDHDQVAGLMENIP